MEKIKLKLTNGSLTPLERKRLWIQELHVYNNKNKCINVLNNKEKANEYDYFNILQNYNKK